MDIETCSKCAPSPFQSRLTASQRTIYIILIVQCRRPETSYNQTKVPHKYCCLQPPNNSHKDNGARLFLENPMQKDEWQQTKVTGGKSSLQ